jgi:hypothetical protein
LSSVRADAIARRDRGDLNSARVLLERALEAAAMTSGEDHPEVLVTAHLLAKLHRQSGDLSGARRVLENALYAGSHRHGDDHPLLLSISFDLAEIADELGNRHEARKHYNRIARFGPAAPGFDQQQVQAARAWLGPGTPPMAPVQGQPITLPAPEPIAPAPPPPAEPPRRVEPVRHVEPPRSAQPAWPPPPSADSVVSQPLVPGEPLPRRVPSVPPAPQSQPRPMEWEATAEGEPAAADSGGLGARLAASGAPVQEVRPQQPASGAQDAPGGLPPLRTPAQRAQTAAPQAERPAGRHSAPPALPRQDAGSAAGARYAGAPAPTPVVAPAVVAPPVVPPIVAGRPIELPPPPPPRRRGRGLLVTSLTAAVVAVAAAGLTVFFVLHPKGKEPDPLPTGPSGAATNLALLDRGDRITLSWIDPSNGQAQPVVAGSRENEAPRQMARPAKGATETTLLSLNKNYEYCFTILLYYSVDDIRQSEQVCTNRKKATSAPTA